MDNVPVRSAGDHAGEGGQYLQTSPPTQANGGASWSADRDGVACQRRGMGCGSYGLNADRDGSHSSSSSSSSSSSEMLRVYQALFSFLLLLAIVYG